MTVSEFSRGELTDLLGLPSERVSVIAGGVDPAFTPQADSERSRAALGLARPVRALCRIPDRAQEPRARSSRPRRRSRRTASRSSSPAGTGPQFAREAGLEALRHLGAVPDALLPGLYAGAEAFALPSLYEGFGLPVLEAMACGTPVIAADATALPETAGGAARLAAPAAVSDAVCEVVRSPAERERLRAAGLARAAPFTWERTARAVDARLSERVASPHA